MKKMSERDKKINLEIQKRRTKMAWLGVAAVVLFAATQVSRNYFDERGVVFMIAASLVALVVGMAMISPYLVISALGPIFAMLAAMLACVGFGFMVLFGVPSLADWMDTNDTASVVVFLALLAIAVVIGLTVLYKISGPLTAWADRKLQESVARGVDAKSKK